MTVPAHHSEPDRRLFTRTRSVFALLLGSIGIGYLGLALYHQVKSASDPDNVAQQAEKYLKARLVVPLSGPLSQLLAAPTPPIVETDRDGLFDKPAPPFDLGAASGGRERLADLIVHGPAVVVFYYGYGCNHCVAQLFALNQDVARFRELGAQIVAISGDPPALTRERFRQYGQFEFPVLADSGHRIARSYGVAMPATGEEDDLLHGTFIVGRDGIVHWAKTGDEPFTDNRTLLYEVARLEGRLPAAGQSK